METDVADLMAAGYTVGESTQEFLREFGGLTLRYKRNGWRDEMCFDIDQVKDPLWATSVNDYADRVGVPLIPVGWAANTYLLVVRAEDGRMFGGYEDELVYLGASTFEAIENLMLNRTEEVP